MFAVVFLGFVGAVLLVALAREVRRDGYGLRPPPRSHEDDPWAELRVR